MMFDLAVVHCGELLTLASHGGGPKRGPAASDLGLIHDGAVGVVGDQIAWIGSQKNYRRLCRAKREIDAKGRVVMPGFVDPHTHAVFAGSREGEWAQRITGLPYLEILKQGGGILATVEATRLATPKALYRAASANLKKMFSYGTTTVEIKSGYGLNLENEIKILKVIQRLKKSLPIDIVPTFMGAHTVPKERLASPEAYLDQVIAMLPLVKPYAEFCDIFCEEGAFSFSQCKRILEAAQKEGFRIKLHAGQFSDQGGVGLAIAFHATSVDHIDIIKKRDIPLLAKSGIIGVLLPGASHFAVAKRHPPARALIEAGLPVALATDFNPGTSPCPSMQEIIHLAVLNFKMSAAEAISAATLNAAHAIGMGQQIGSLEVGKQADILILDLDHYQQLPYYFGVNHVTLVIKKGLPSF